MIILLCYMHCVIISYFKMWNISFKIIIIITIIITIIIIFVLILYPKCWTGETGLVRRVGKTEVGKMVGVGETIKKKIIGETWEGGTEVGKTRVIRMNYSCKEQTSLVPKMFAPLKFDRIFGSHMLLSVRGLKSIYEFILYFVVLSLYFSY